MGIVSNETVKTVAVVGIGLTTLFGGSALAVDAISESQGCVPQDHIRDNPIAYFPQTLIFSAMGVEGKGNCLAGWQPKVS